MADNVVQDIKDKLDIVEVVGSYVPLKRAGVNWRTNCPFHNEKSPSFNVNPARQIWHCFGCGEGGDVFSFVQKYEHLDFPEVLKVLADKAGVQLPERNPADVKRKEQAEQLYRVNAFCAAYYHKNLLAPQSSTAKQYLLGRGLTEQTIALWQVGLAPLDSALLERALIAKGAKQVDLLDAGVFARSARGLYDRFWGRVTFPIWNFSGKVVGFSARILPDKTKPDTSAAKYINSPESPVYTKGQVLFGLWQAKSAIRERDYVVVVEGQMDCIKVHQAGFANTVATSGTAVTQDQLRLLLRLTKNIVLAFDADPAGQKASRKTGELALRMGFAVKVVRMGNAKDPDELLSAEAGAWASALKASELFVLRYIQQAEAEYVARSAEQRKFLAEQVVPLIALVQDALEKEYYIKEIMERFGFSAAVLNQMLQQAPEEQQARGVVQSSSRKPVDAPNGDLALEKRMIGAFLGYPSIFQEWLDLGGSEDDFSGPETHAILDALRARNPEAANLSVFAKEASFMVESEKTREGGTEAAYILELRKTLYTFHLTALKNRQQQLTARIRSAEAEKDPAILRDLQRAFAVLTQQRLSAEKQLQSF